MTTVVDLIAEAKQLQLAARRLIGVRPDLKSDPALKGVATYPVTKWDQAMLARAAAVIADAEATPTAATDAALSASLAALDAPQPPTVAQQRAARASTPFDYDHTIDGLRGIPLTELACLSGDAPQRLAAYGLESVYDLLVHVPLRYVDRSTVSMLCDLRGGDEATIIGTVRSLSQDRTKNGTRLAKIEVEDRSGVLYCTFFQMPWKVHQFNHGDEVVVHGAISEGHGKTGRLFLNMTNPLMERTGSKTAPIIPIYPQSAKSKVTTWEIHRAAMEAVARLGDLTDPVPADRTRVGSLMGRRDAFKLMHNPSRPGEEAAARERLAYDELLRMQLALRMRRLADASAAGVSHTPTGHLTGQMLAALPFPLTGAQQRAIAQIRDGLVDPSPLHRLIQGDVGAGKTMVAAQSLLMAVEGGHQGALMAPTEILATQLANELTERLEGITKPDGAAVTVELLAGRQGSRVRRDTLQRLAAGDVDIIVGTHALLVDDVQFHQLGLVVIDEQHRFGVEQRAALTAKGAGLRPDTIVMTATPIPRTAAMTVFGDLDVTVLDELPPGRTPIDTVWHPETPDPGNPFDPVWAAVRRSAGEGRQAYVVCPLVEDSETKAAASAESTAAALAAGALLGLRVGVAHGKQKPAERAEVMGQFKAGLLDVLVATTVIEVGVNVPNAATIVILEPKSFGIAQLHQLRGRVGRGQWASTCYLAGEANSDATQRRLEALVATTDGFALSETDLQIRGAGEVLGARQSGLTDLHVASLDTDRGIIEAAREDAARLLEGDPTLTRRPVLRAEVRSALGDAADHFLTAT